MYDDLLGKRNKNKKEDIPLDIGRCGQCEHVKDSPDPTIHAYCTKLKKYINMQQVGCLQFKRKELKIIIS